jgi:polyphenol oxidase
MSQAADMGLLDTAAQDPIFFAHHANIDRLWNVWLNNATTHQNPTSTAWLNHQFTFWDENKRWVSIKISDVINMSSSLRYTYGAVVKRPELLAPIISKLINANRTLTLPPDTHKRVTGAGGPQKSTYRSLRIEGITLPPNVKGVYRIVANKPAAGAAEVNGTENDLGYFAVVPKTSKDPGGHLHGVLNIELDVTDKLQKLVQANGMLTLSYVPMAGGAKGIQLPYKDVYIVEQ